MLNWILSASLLIAMVIALRYLLRGKLHPAVQYALWGLVLVRLLLPFSIAHTPVSLSSAVEQTTLAQDMERVQHVESVERESDGTIVGKLPTYTMPDGELVEHYTKIADSADDGELMRLQSTVSVKKIVRPVWYIGIGLTAAWFLVVNVIFTRSLRRSREKVECDSKRPVYVTAAVDTPCLYGLFHPAIYVTPEVVTDEDKLRHVLTHETMHYRHGDHIWSLLRVVCLCLHWYNPLVWWAAALSRRDAELCCDAAAIKSLGEEQRGDYGRTLIGLSCQSAGPNDLLLTATTMTGGKRSLRERIKLIAQKPQTKAIAAFAVIVVAVLAVVITFTGSAPGGSYLRWTAQMSRNGFTYRTHYAKDVDTVTVHVEEYQDGVLVNSEVQPYVGDLKYLTLRFYGPLYSGENGNVLSSGYTHIEGNGGKAFTIEVPNNFAYDPPYAEESIQSDGIVYWYPQENVSFSAGSKFTLGLYTCDSSFDALSVPSQEVNEKTVDEYQRILGEPRTATGAAVLVWAEFGGHSQSGADMGGTIQGNNRAPWIKFDLNEKISHVTLVAEEYQDGELLDIHRETLEADGLKNLYPKINIAEDGQLQLDLRRKGKGYDVTESWPLSYTFGEGKCGGYNWFNKLAEPMPVRAGDRVCLLSGNYQEGSGSEFLDPMFLTLDPANGLEYLDGYAVVLWAEFGGPAVDYGVPDEDGWVSNGITGVRTRYWMPTNVPTVQTATFTFQDLQAVTLRLSHYEKGELVEQKELPFTGLEVYAASLKQEGNTWTAGISAYHDRHGGEDDWTQLSFDAEGRVFLTSYCDGSNTNNFVLSPNQTYYLAAAAWGNSPYTLWDYQNNPPFIATADHLVIYELDVYTAGSELPENNVTVWSDKQMKFENDGSTGAVYNFDQLYDATLRLKHYKKGVLVDEQSFGVDGMKQLTAYASPDPDSGKWRVLALDAGGVNYSPTPLKGQTLAQTTLNAVIDFDGKPGFSGDWLPITRGDMTVYSLTRGNTYCFAAFVWGKDWDYYCEEYLTHPEFCSKPDELVLLELELPKK